MRITTLIIGIQVCCTTLILANSSKAQSISIDVKQVPITQVFKTIESQAGVTFTYNENTIRNIGAVSLKIINKPLDVILKEIKKITPLEFKQQGNLIGVSRAVMPKSPPPLPIKVTTVTSLPIKITGEVTDEKGTPLPGVTVYAPADNKTAVTNADGVFSIVISNQQIKLQFSYIGYEKQEIVPGSEHNLIIRLLRTNAKLDEVHVIAYGTTTERLTTGSLGKINAEDISGQPVSNPLATLEGRVPGLVVTQSNGVAGSMFKVQVRGQNSITQGSDPLFIIDGAPYAANNNALNQLASSAATFSNEGLSAFSSINPRDIESIEVLKDADATSIYGSRGANGVIIITTKKGKAGKTQADFNVNSGISNITREMNMLTTQQYTQMRTEAFKNDGVAPNTDNAPDLLVFDQNRYTDMKKMLIGNTAHSTDVEGSVSGGNSNTQFLLSGAYNYNSTVFPGSMHDDRGSAHFSLSHSSANKKFTLNFSTLYSSESNNLIDANLVSYITAPPNSPAFFDGSGHIAWQYNGVILDNPMSYLLDKYKATTDNMVSSLQLSYHLFTGFTIKTDFGYNILHFNETDANPAAAQNPAYSPQGYADFGTNLLKSWNVEPQAEYRKVISKGILSVLAGATFQDNANSNTLINAFGYTSDALLQSESAATTLIAVNQFNQYRYTALFGRINFNWQDKYIINASGRRDGSSRFGSGKQFADFGAIGAAWLFSNESWVKNHVGFLSFGKLRASYGASGNDQIGNYQYLDTWTSTRNTYYGSPGLYPTRLYNSDYSWEINKKLEMAIDLGFLEDRILFSAAYYRNHSSNQLISYRLPSQTGFLAVTQNFPGLVENKGWEFQFTTTNIKTKDFNWITNANISIPTNRLLSFPNLGNSSYAGIYIIGQSLNVITGYKSLGVDPQSGVAQFADINHDGIMDGKDFVVLGSKDPQYYGGLGNTFNYTGVQFDVFFEFKKQLAPNFLYYEASSYPPGTMYNQPTAVLNRWQVPGNHAAYQQFTATPGTAAYTAAQSYLSTSSAAFSDASFIRMKTLGLSYFLPQALTAKMHLQRLKLFLQGQNLLTITGYNSGDPETANPYVLPPLKTLVAGIQITL